MANEVKPKIAVLYHDDADGFGAAYACWHRLRGWVTPEDVVYLPVQYHQPVPDLPESVVTLYIVDFSYDRQTLMQLAERFGYRNLMVIDHHKSARAELAGLPFVEFDEGRSGAVLAWEHLHRFQQDPPPPPMILQYVQDRDLWRFALPWSRSVNAYIAALPRSFAMWDQFDLETAVDCGAAIMSFQLRQMESRLKDVRVVEDFMGSGYDVPVVNATENMSELGNMMCRAYPDAPFSVSYCDRGDGGRSYSLRSMGEFDVSEVARQFGGGGHRNAAGFACRLPEVWA